MLVLARKEGQTIKIGDDIQIIVVGMEDNQVRIGVEAPKDIKVIREEIEKKIKHL
ncbi:carbon storage regulator CsrA (plasmid) [Rossellomorea sp. AcN35-11]|nr:carbon storage regulator CsrA [Rossellomorea aquimaris]WJV32220.1 carbon storage regulator CsrA [Rossellomorea sp. AcN35-11]